MPHPVVVAITGASGAVYGVRLVEMLIASDVAVHLAISDSGFSVIEQELGVRMPPSGFDAARLWEKAAEAVQRIRYFDNRDFMSPMASGSFRTRGMVICPCSGSTLQAVASGASQNLIQRAAEVHLKERRKLILVPRETPLSLSHIENMRRSLEAGAVVLPASPGWYHGVREIRDLVDFIVGRILDQLGIEHSLIPRWGTDERLATDRVDSRGGKG